MKTLILLITLIVVFVLGYMLGTFNARPTPAPLPSADRTPTTPAPTN